MDTLNAGNQLPSPVEADLHSRESRSALAQMVMRLFEHWGIATADQSALLGLSDTSRASLARYRRGEPLADSRDLIDRAACLLAIHRALRIIFPHNRELAYLWPVTPNRRFGGKTPVGMVREYGFEGLLMVRRYLDFERGE